MTRKLYEVAREIRQEWKKVSPYAEPYLEAMESLNSVSDNYYYDTGKSVVLYFLANAQSFRGEAARRIKAELKSLV